jgi:hypothetical protein
MQLQRSPLNANRLQHSSLNRSCSFAPQRAARVRTHAGGNSETDLAATKKKLKDSCLTKSTPPDLVLQYLSEIEKANRTSSQVQSTF